MRTTLDIDSRLMREAFELVHPKSKRELIEFSLREVIRKEHLKRMVGRIGRMTMVESKDFLSMRRHD